jgi:hypothetical protein
MVCNLSESLRLHGSPFGKWLGNIFLQVEQKRAEQALEYVVECVCGKCDKYKTLETRIKLCKTKMVWNHLLIVFCIIRFPMGFHKGSKEFQTWLSYVCFLTTLKIDHRNVIFHMIVQGEFRWSLSIILNFSFFICQSWKTPIYEHSLFTRLFQYTW